MAQSNHTALRLSTGYREAAMHQYQSLCLNLDPRGAQEGRPRVPLLPPIEVQPVDHDESDVAFFGIVKRGGRFLGFCLKPSYPGARWSITAEGRVRHYPSELTLGELKWLLEADRVFDGPGWRSVMEAAWIQQAIEERWVEQGLVEGDA